MSAIFIDSGVHKAMDPAATIGMMQRYGQSMPQVAFYVAVLVELVGGLAVLIGFRTRSAAIVLAAWCVATAFVAHYHPGDTNQMIHFMKNLCMAGGFLQVAAWGAGRFSADRG